MSLAVQLVQGDLVALEQHEQSPVPEYLVDQPIEDLRRPLERHVRRVDPAQGSASELVETQVELDQDVLLAGEVVVDRRLGEAQPLGYLAQRGLLVALLGEQLQGDVEDPLACGVLLCEPFAGIGLGPRIGPGRRHLRPCPILLDNR